jgi:FG-GAP repeat protein/HYR domain-containing protein
MTYIATRRYRSVLSVSLLIIAALVLILRPTRGSVARAAVETMPALRGEKALSHLKDKGIYESLQSAAASSTTFTQQQKLTAPDGAAGDFFGGAVAMTGDTAVVGASAAGAVYVFVRANDGPWTLQQKLVVSPGFGNSVAISGDTIVAGFPSENSGAGSAYVFIRAGSVWHQQQRLTASDSVADNDFGIAVGISGDTVVVGARFSRTGPHPQQGSAYVFVRSGGTWSEQQHLTATDGGLAEFYGDAVAISGDTVVIGAAAVSEEVPQQEHGSAYVYVRESGVWNLQQQLVSGVTLGENLFGCSVAIEGDIIAVGAIFGNAAYVFERTGATWGSAQPLSGGFGEFGISVSVSGGTVVVGGRNQRVGDNFGQGATFVFLKEFGQWHESQMLTASDGAANDRFGYSVAISGDTIVIGSPFDQVGNNETQGSAYVFSPNGPPAIATSTVTVQQGRSLIGANIATVSDNETSAAALTVSIVSGGTATGVTLTNVANTGGVITANVSASCTATGGTVRLQVTDGGGLSTSADLQVNVTPNDPPVINCSANLVKSTDPGRCSAVVTFTVTATDDCDGAVVPICTPPSGSTFAKGTTTVTCTASDSSGHTSSCSFTVTVNDTEKPTIACPANVTVVARRPGDATVTVNYQAPAVEDNCGIQSVVCLPPSGSAFPVGATTVTCTATDTSGNTASCSFTVTVFDVCLQDDTNPNTAMVWNSVTGDYLFCCGGVTYTGRGVVTRTGSIFTLTHNVPDRRLIASVDATQNRGTATLQSPPGVVRGTINDRDIRNNTCACVGAGRP